METGQKMFSWVDYKWRLSGDSFSNVAFKKYTTEGAKLELEDDAAHIHMGGDWHMPTYTQIEEMYQNTLPTWTTQDGVNGRLFTSNKNGKSIFIPAAGRAEDGSVKGSGSQGCVCSSMLNNPLLWRTLYFVQTYIGPINQCRYNGLPVRGVIDG